MSRSAPQSGAFRTAALAVVALLVSGLLSLAPGAATASDGTSVRGASSRSESPGSAAQVTSPGAVNSVTVSAAGGRLSYRVEHRGRTLVGSSTLGLELHRGGVLGRDVEIAGTRVREADSTWRPVWGADARVRDHHRELVVVTRERSAPHRRLDVVVRAYDDGVAVRYRIPRQRGLDRLRIVDEQTAVDLVGDPTAWWHPRDDDSDEDLYQRTSYSRMKAANLPATFRYGNGLHVSVHEADLVDYPAATAGPSVRGGGLRYRLVPTPGRPYAVDTHAGRTTPWRALTIGDRAGDLMESHLLENLNPPCAICGSEDRGKGHDRAATRGDAAREKGDGASWIKPTTYVGIWWDLQKGRYTWHEGPDHGATTERAKEYIDFAADHGIGGLLAEGWNKGWFGEWSDQDFTKSADGFDLAEVVRYGKAKGVELVAHNETGAGVENYERQIDQAFALYERLGIHYLKTGYVGKIPGHNHYDQRMVKHYRTVLRKAAEHRIMVDCHECVHASGETRTYPNAISREAVRGQEWDAFSDGNPPGHTLVLPFTRGLAGPMDYTPGIVNPAYDPKGTGRRVHTTVAKQLAYYVQFLSGVQMAADTPANYRGHPGALRFIERVPATWDETRVLSAEVGEHLTVARRHGRAWYVGSSTGERARSTRVPLSFLPPGRWVAETWTDDASADEGTKPAAVERRRFLVDRFDVLRGAVGKGGGQAVRLTPATSAQQAALPDYAPPAFTYRDLSVPQSTSAGEPVRVTARVRNTGSLVGAERAVLFVDGTPAQARRIRVAGRGAAEAVFEVRIGTPGRHAVGIGNAPARWITVRPLPR